MKTQVITITYAPSSIPCFHEDFRDALRAYAKVCGSKSKLEISEEIPRTLCSRPFCWYFCWCRGSNRSWRISLFQHRKAARQAQQGPARPFKQWADECMRDPKTIEVLELRVGYVKDRFGKLCRQDIKRPDVLAFMRSYEADFVGSNRGGFEPSTSAMSRCPGPSKRLVKSERLTAVRRRSPPSRIAA
jgi:hypothetical protein